MTRDKLVEKIADTIYDIVLAARTEGVVGGKTKWLAKGDTDDILDTPLNDDVCSKCHGKGTGWEKILGQERWMEIPCPKCSGTGKQSKTIRNLIEEYYADS